MMHHNRTFRLDANKLRATVIRLVLISLIFVNFQFKSELGNGLSWWVFSVDSMLLHSHCWRNKWAEILVCLRIFRILQFSLFSIVISQRNRFYSKLSLFCYLINRCIVVRECSTYNNCQAILLWLVWHCWIPIWPMRFSTKTWFIYKFRLFLACSLSCVSFTW